MILGGEIYVFGGILCAMKDRFPGFEVCMQMMRQHDAMTAEDGFHWLFSRTGEFVDELVVEFHSESNAEAGFLHRVQTGRIWSIRV